MVNTALIAGIIIIIIANLPVIIKKSIKIKPYGLFKRI